ncbi:LacI family DNA-binding transcriptional regulator [Cellulomonas marina]|uniref:DNA-binding transcriptional regulator, LacI/PurR family n=1 Tax=Cellulomonas marina TaxID=988821 RepID=A0A1I0W3V8_9CELL|nr:LacI family DNA-binding transcriptional regulator [Cellulomonas marina]GIG29958.1 alanine racemase [Cellulomonas marina]SFA83037.1 DNA-binding transcriptional regulator, LacI/PurR family [Cellulomonas marina]
MHTQGRPTLEDVARRAAVSRQTVSNVLNAPHVVRSETAARVQAAIAELGYRPSAAGRALRTRRSRVLGLRMEPQHDGINGAVSDRFLHGLTEGAQERGYRVMLFTAPDDAAEIGQYDDLLDTADIDAFVLTATHHGDPRTGWLARRGVPFVTFGRPWDPPDGSAPADHPWVDVDGAAGTRAAVEHLLALGHRRIGWVGWPEGSDTGADRRRGWAEALAAAGVPQAALAELTAGVDDGIATGRAAATELLARPDGAPTAFVCASDSLAIGVAAALGDESRGAVVGFDDTPVAAALGLSSVAQPLQEAAGRTLDLLLHRLDGGHPPVPDPHVLLTPRLVVRATSGPTT